MERKLGIFASCLPGVKDVDALKMIKAAGFETTFTSYRGLNEAVEVRNETEKLGLDFDFIHAPFYSVNTLWTPGLDCYHIYNDLIECLDVCAEVGVKVAVMHVSSGWYPPQLSDVGFGRFDSLVEHADKKGVNIAFENIRKLGNVAAIMERYEKVPNVGFCYDCGHEHCYTETVPFVTLYGNRMLCTHLHDNFGRHPNDPNYDPDYHMMPYDGNMDYQEMMDRINAVHYKGSLTLELSKQRKYWDISDEEYLDIAYQRLSKLAVL